MHQNTFLTTPYIKNIVLKNLILVCTIRKNMFLPTSDVKKYLFYELDSGCQEVCANASKHVFKHFRR
jgi:hypothetical protein